MAKRPKFKLVEFHHHRGDDEPQSRDTGAETETKTDVGDALDRDEEPEPSGSSEDASGSWLQRLGGVALLGGLAFALARRRKEARAAIGHVREGDTVSRLRESEYAAEFTKRAPIDSLKGTKGASRLAGRDPVSRLRESEDAETQPDLGTGAGARTEADAPLDDVEGVASGPDISAVDAENAANGESGVEAAEGVADAEGVGTGPDVGSIDEEEGAAETDDPTASADVASNEDTETENDVGLAPKADAETDVGGESDDGHDETGGDGETGEDEDTDVDES